jgi:hypothetical protein
MWLHIYDWYHITQLNLHIGDVFVTVVTIHVRSCHCATRAVASSRENMLIGTAYIADHLGLISLSLLMYYFTFMQAILMIHLHNKTRSALVTQHYYCLGTSSNQPWWT